MWKFFVIVLLLVGIFWSGYYVGQQPPSKVKTKLRTISEDVIGKTLGLEKDKVSLQHEFLNAKARILEGKSRLIDGNYEEAAKELEEALYHLKNTLVVKGKETSQILVDGLIEKINDIKKSLISGQEVSRKTIDEAQKELDKLLTE